MYTDFFKSNANTYFKNIVRSIAKSKKNNTVITDQ